MGHKKLFLLILLATPGVAQVVPHGCSALAAEWGTRDLWIVVDGQSPRRVLSTERPVSAASLSSDVHHIAFSVYPPSSDSAVEAVIAEVSGRILGRFKIDQGYTKGGNRDIDQIEWRGPRTLVTLGSAGPHGGYFDVWDLSPGYSGAKRVRRALILGGRCAVSPSTQYVACSDGNTIMIFDTLSPADEDGVVDEQHFFVTPREGEPDETLNTNLAWNGTRTALYAARSVRGNRLLTTIEKNSAAPEGWSVTDRDLVGIDSPVDSVEFDAHGALLLGAGGKTYRVDEATGGSRAAAVAHVISTAAIRQPGLLPAARMEVASDHGKLRLKVLDTYCPRGATQR